MPAITLLAGVRASGMLLPFTFENDIDRGTRNAVRAPCQAVQCVAKHAAKSNNRKRTSIVPWMITLFAKCHVNVARNNTIVPHSRGNIIEILSALQAQFNGAAHSPPRFIMPTLAHETQFASLGVVHSTGKLGRILTDVVESARDSAVFF